MCTSSVSISIHQFRHGHADRPLAHTWASFITELHGLSLTGLWRRLETRFLRPQDGVDCWGDWTISISKHSPSTGLCCTGVPLGVGEVLIFFFPAWKRERKDTRKESEAEAGAMARWGHTHKKIKYKLVSCGLITLWGWHQKCVNVRIYMWITHTHTSRSAHTR